jgi:hypothetical protein
MNVTLSPDRSVATVDGETLQVSQVIEYKSSDEDKIGAGKIVQFKHPGFQQSDTTSVWMFVADAVDGCGEWLSLAVWKEQKDKGLFNQINEPTKTQPNASVSNAAEIIPTDTDDLW